MGITQGVCWGLLRGVLRSDIGQRGVFLVEVKMRSSSTGPYYGAICALLLHMYVIDLSASSKFRSSKLPQPNLKTV